MVMLEGDHVGQIILSGPGAGEGPTASAVMSDIIDIREYKTTYFWTTGKYTQNCPICEIKYKSTILFTLITVR